MPKQFIKNLKNKSFFNIFYLVYSTYIIMLRLNYCIGFERGNTKNHSSSKKSIYYLFLAMVYFGFPYFEYYWLIIVSYLNGWKK